MNDNMSIFSVPEPYDSTLNIYFHEKRNDS